jgi:hypothetical protein
MDEPIEEGISRRSAIKRIGVVGAVAWSAPVLSSMSAPAFAQGGSGPNPECAGAQCGTFTQCSSGNPDCVCVSLSGGGGLCVPGSTQCAGLTLCPTGTECAPGELCAVNTCCVNAVCVPVALECEKGTGSSGAARASSGANTIGG